MASIFDVFGGDIQQQAANQKIAGLNQAYQQYTDLANQARGALTTNYAQAMQPYQALQPTANAGYSAYADATGANGPEGLARANAQFLQATPGFAGAAQRAADMAARAGVAGGQATGNTLAGIADRTTQMGLQAYGDYVSRLAPWLQQGQQTASGLSGISTGLGNQLASSFAGQGGQAYNTQTGIGNAQAEGTMGELTGLQNLWGLGMNAAKLGASMIPGMGPALGASTLMSGLTNKPGTGLGPVPSGFGSFNFG